MQASSRPAVYDRAGSRPYLFHSQFGRVGFAKTLSCLSGPSLTFGGSRMICACGRFVNNESCPVVIVVACSGEDVATLQSPLLHSVPASVEQIVTCRFRLSGS